MNALRRGACPGISAPMLTGDGLLVRLVPSAPISMDVFIALCEASQAHGNGIVEVTQRGSFQVRGLSPASAPAFARTVTALGLGSGIGPVIVTSPLLGLEAEEPVELTALIAALRSDLASRTELASLAPKVSLLIDGGGALHLDGVPADLRIQVGNAFRLHVAMAANAAASKSLGWVEPQHVVEVVAHVLARIASRGPNARARDFTNGPDLYSLRAALAGLLTHEPPPPPRPAPEPIAIHALKNGQVAQGVALAFGYSDAPRLQRLARAAELCGAASIRPAPGRALLMIGLSPKRAEALAATAASEGFIIRPGDPRRFVIACAGAPACGSGLLTTRSLAPEIALAAQPFFDGTNLIHLSGCAKGCAHPGVAALTLVGPDRVVVLGRAGDTPQGAISAANFVAGLRRLHTEGDPPLPLAALVRQADFVARLGAIRPVESTHSESAHD
jgi:precorrin-3B synthase